MRHNARAPIFLRHSVEAVKIISGAKLFSLRADKLEGFTAPGFMLKATFWLSLLLVVQLVTSSHFCCSKMIWT